MSIADKYRPQYTYADYVRWEGDWELIDGMPYAMSPAPAIIHQKISGTLHTIFKESLKKSCIKCEVYLPVDWKINEKTVVQPDLLILCREISIDKIYLDFTPALVVEILSPSTAYKDRHEKFELYEQEGVKYYLIVDPQFKKIEVYQLIEGKYQPVAITPTDFTFLLEEGCDLPVDFAGTFD
jgi:Uma2 family endonuclease